MPTLFRSLRSPLTIVVCGALMMLICNGLRANSGLWLQPMSLAHGWGREVFALAIALQNFLWGVGSTLFGAIADKYGAGRALVTGAVLYGLGMAGMAYASTPVELYLSTGMLIGFGIAGTSYTVVLGVFSRIARPEQRSLLMGVGTAAGSMGQFIMLPVGQAWINSVGWQQALLLQLGLIALMLPLAYGLSGRPQQAQEELLQSSTHTATPVGLMDALREALHDRSFHLLFWGYFTCGFQVVFIGLHLPSYLVDQGLPTTLGASAIAVVGLSNIAGSFLSGWLGGRYSKKLLLSGLYFLRSVVILVFILSPLSVFSVYVFAACMGLLWLSTVPLTQGLVGQIYGLRYVSTLVGVVFMGHQIGSFLGAWLGGKIYDMTGSYDLAWWLIIGSGFYAAVMHLPIREQPLALRRAADLQAV